MFINIKIKKERNTVKTGDLNSAPNPYFLPLLYELQESFEERVQIKLYNCDTILLERSGFFQLN